MAKWRLNVCPVCGWDSALGREVWGERLGVGPVRRISPGLVSCQSDERMRQAVSTNRPPGGSWEVRPPDQPQGGRVEGAPALEPPLGAQCVWGGASSHAEFGQWDSAARRLLCVSLGCGSFQPCY